jgi:uncharacterized membrane protein
MLRFSGLRLAILACVSASALSSCERNADPPAATAPTLESSASAPASTEPAAAMPATAAEPAESSLAVKRGIIMLAQDRMTFRMCGDKAELWLVDQTDGVLKQAFADQGTGPTMLYAEVNGERGAVAPDVPAAAAYGGSFLLEEVQYAALQSQTRGCDGPAPDYIIAARGNESSWSAEVFETEVRWREAGQKDVVLPEAQTQDAEGAARYHSKGNGHELDLAIEQQQCREASTGEYFAYAAKATFDGKEYAGCARVGS